MKIYNLKNIIDKFEIQPEIIILNINVENDFLSYIESLNREFSQIDFIIIPEKVKNQKLPLYVLHTNEFQNIHFASNPCTLKLFNRNICLINDDIIEKIKNENFDVKNNVKQKTNKICIYDEIDFKNKTAKIILSQNSLNFTRFPGQFFEYRPDCHIILFDFYEYLNTVDDSKFVIFGNFRTDSRKFIVYDSSDNRIDFCNYENFI